MGSRSLVAAAVVGAVLLWAATAVASSPASERMSPGQAPCVAVYRAGDQVCAIRPHWLSTGAHTLVRKIDWRRWGNGPAVGRARFYNAGSVGNPDEELRTTARLKFSRMVQCEGHLWYSRFKIVYGGGHVYRKGFYATPCSFERPSIGGSRPGWSSCDPPPDTFYYRVTAYRTTCNVARRVLTEGKCTNLPRCSQFRYRSWRCHVGSSISDRATICRNGQRRIIGRASGD